MRRRDSIHGPISSRIRSPMIFGLFCSDRYSTLQSSYKGTSRARYASLSSTLLGKILPIGSTLKQKSQEQESILTLAGQFTIVQTVGKPVCLINRYLHIPATLPGMDDEPTDSIVWWRNKNYVIGKLTSKSRKIRIINMLTHHTDIIEVPTEETIEEIQQRYKLVNDHA